MIYGEGEPVSVMEYIDQEIESTRRYWVGEMATEVLRINPRDRDAEDLAKAYRRGKLLPRRAFMSFLERRGIGMLAVICYPNTQPDSEKYPYLFMHVSTPTKSRSSIIDLPLN